MTLEEFFIAEPVLASLLLAYVGHPRHAEVERVFRNPDGRWEAHLCMPPRGDFERVLEARCHEHCVNSLGSRRSWVYEDHVCCEACRNNPGHYYQAVHE